MICKINASYWLTGSRLIVTAGHCLEFPKKVLNATIKLSHFLLGAHNISTPNEIGSYRINYTPSIEIIRHQRYDIDNLHGGNDIGLIVLKDKVNLTRYIKVACMGNFVVPISSEVTIYGWGKTEEGGNIMYNDTTKSSDIIMMSKTRIIHLQKFKWLYKEISFKNFEVVKKNVENTKGNVTDDEIIKEINMVDSVSNQT